MENNMFSGIFRGRKIKNREKSRPFTQLVEAAGVEPASENIFTRASPSAVCDSEFPPLQVHKQPHKFGSFIMHACGKAYAGHVHC